ncbi:MAG: hypothetical protein A3A28_05720 [Candidatus Sungbacteria bacterium RIFCSPLOWO2_01_FULL_47_32]|nr:MAG: hypothetical protein A3A28_05720 [Candidatus Sungbacteria bacterium RIFCSPLOWO2_01_FULL_47_32]
MLRCTRYLSDDEDAVTREEEIISNGVEKLVEVLTEKGGAVHMAALEYFMLNAHVFPGGPVGRLRDPQVMFNLSVRTAEKEGKVSYDKSTGVLSLASPNNPAVAG